MKSLAATLVGSAVFGALIATAALAAQITEATLAAPVAERRQVIVDGKLWTCEAARCVSGNTGISQPLTRECARAARVLGPIVAYRRGETALTANQIKACND